jgi:hypothetical protein
MESAPSWKLEWIQERTDMKGSIPALQFQQTTGDDDLSPWPAEDTTYTTECSLIVDANNWCYNYDGYMWYGRQLVSRKYSATSDGEDARSLERKNEVTTFDQGVIHTPAFSNAHAAEGQVRPISWCFWPFDPARGGVPKESIRLLPGVRVHDGEELFGIEAFTKQGIWQLWLDPKDYVVRIGERQSNGVLNVHIEAEYRFANDQGIVYPSRWTVERLHRSRIETEYVCTTSSFVLEPETSSGTFETKFPVHALVIDDRANKTYIVTKSGKMREVNPATVDHAELVAQAEGQSAVGPIRKLLIVINIVVAVLLAGFLALQKWYKNHQP